MRSKTHLYHISRDWKMLSYKSWIYYSYFQEIYWPCFFLPAWPHLNIELQTFLKITFCELLTFESRVGEIKILNYNENINYLVCGSIWLFFSTFWLITEHWWDRGVQCTWTLSCEYRFERWWCTLYSEKGFRYL